METIRVLRPTLQAGLASARHWLSGMVDSSNNRLFYEFSPEKRRRVHKLSPIRDLGTVADLAALQRFAGGHEFSPAIAVTLDYYQSMLVKETTFEEEGIATAEGLGGTATEAELGDAPLPWALLDPARLGEPSSIAHNAFMILGLSAWEDYPHEAEQEKLLTKLANGISHQQRSDGTYKVYFSPSDWPDHGWQLYSGEAMLALLTSYVRLGEELWWSSVSRGLPAYQKRFERGDIEEDELVFFANWQTQAGRLLVQHTTDNQQRSEMAAYLHSMQDAIKQRGFFEDVKQAPGSVSTVEVACELEALSDVLAVAIATGDSDREATYAEGVRTLIAFLDRAQVKPGPDIPPEAVGGFGHTLQLSTQRIDVTGHVLGAYMKLLSLVSQE